MDSEINIVFQYISPIETLGLTIIGEARGEPVEGQVAVGCVIRNRLYHNPEKYKSYKDVCLEPSQFSCWNPVDPNYGMLLDLAIKLINNQTITDLYLRQCLFVAQGIANNDIRDNTHGALNYLTSSLFNLHPPSWAKNPKKMITYGKQVFITV